MRLHDAELLLLPRPARLAFIVIGLALIPAAWPVGYLAMVIAGGGHSSPFDGSATEAVWGAAMLAIPLIMIVIGIACIAAKTPRRARFAGIVALALPLDLALAIGALWYLNRPDPPLAHPVMPRAPEILPGNAVVLGGPTQVAIGCSAKGDECVTRTTTYDSAGKATTTRKVERVTSPARP